MTGNFGTQTVLVSWSECIDFSTIIFVDEAAFREYFDKPWFLELWDEDDNTLDGLMDANLIGFNVVEVIGT